MPSHPWEWIGMDFVRLLPESGNHDGIYDSIMVVICLLTSMVHLVPSHTNYNATQLADDMLMTIYAVQCTQKQHPKPTEGVGVTGM